MSSRGRIPVAKEGELYSLKWQTYQGHISSGLQRLYTSNDTESLRDVTLGSEGQYVKAHKVILSLCSPYFRLLFQTNKAENGNMIIILEHLKFRDLKNVIHFIYNGEIKVKNSDLKGFLRAGESLQIEGLTKGNSDCSDDEFSPPSSKSRRAGATSFGAASASPSSQRSFSQSSTAASPMVHPVIMCTASNATTSSASTSVKRTRLGRLIKPTVPAIDYDDSNFSFEDEVETDLLALESTVVTVERNDGITTTATGGGVVSVNTKQTDSGNGDVFPINIKTEVVGDYFAMNSEDVVADPDFLHDNGALNDSEMYVEYYSRKGALKLACGGYTYSKRQTTRCGIKYYYCDKRNNCRASLINNKGKWSKGAGWAVNGTHPYHAPDVHRTEVEILTGNAKQLANDEPTLTTSQIIQRAVAAAPIEVLALMPTDETMTRKINKTRQRHGHPSVKKKRNPKPVKPEQFSLHDYMVPHSLAEAGTVVSINPTALDSFNTNC